MKRILTGDRPTGKLHLGHYVGSLKNRALLQHDYETFVMIADTQALTDNFESPEKVRENVREVLLDNLAIGLDPNKVTFFIQSQVPELLELMVYFMNMVTLAELQRNPTIKEEMQQKGFGANVPVGFLCYPVSQAADILAFKPDIVPIGEDQRPVTELSKDIAERFNRLYGKTFEIPKIEIGEVGRLVGADGNSKMGKSLGNAIYLADTPEEVTRKVMGMYTDPNRIRSTDPGKVEGNPLFIYLDAFARQQDKSQIDEFKTRYQVGAVGDIEVKQYLATMLNEFLAPIREKRKEYENNPKLLNEILDRGQRKAQQEAHKTLDEVKKAMKISY